MKIGIDFGTSNTKIIGLKKSGSAITTSIRTRKFSRQFLDHALKEIPQDEEVTDIVLTGGNISFFPDTINDIGVTKVTEWDSLYRGIDYLHGDIDCILLNIGSGTSIHLLSNNTKKHIGGSALGGVTIDKFKEYFAIEKTPDLNKLSVLHSDIGELAGEIEGVKSDWPGVYFNNLHLKTPTDEIVAALEQVVADQIMNLAYLYAKTTLHDTFLITGGAIDNPNILNRIEYWAKDHEINLLNHNWNKYISLIGLVGLPNSIEIK